MESPNIDENLDPVICWNSKPEIERSFGEAVPIHHREIISPIQILNEVRSDSQFTQTNLFGDDDAPRDKRQLDCYEFDRGWKNRMIAGDSLEIMRSLLDRENMAGQVQMIYFDPPYGIRFGSNFQPFINQRDVKDRDSDLSTEMETIKAFRDTWERGIHSYLSYIYRRVSKARELLSDSGSLFFQIGDENVHRIRMVLDEVFGSQNLVAQIFVQKSGGMASGLLDSVGDYLLWYANDKKQIKYHQLYLMKNLQSEKSKYRYVEFPDQSRRRMTDEEIANPKILPKGSKIFVKDNLTSATGDQKSRFEVQFDGKIFKIDQRGWRTNEIGMQRLIKANRIIAAEKILYYVQYFDDFPIVPISNLWTDTSGDKSGKLYTVQTSKKILERCILMSTDPGDLVLDITCGSGTTAYVAEQFGRRWITCDTSRIAIEIAKERIATATFDWYKTADDKNNPRAGFKYKTVPHITLKSIANNQPPAEEILYDQPLTDSKRIRVSSAFTVDSLPSPRVMSIDSAARGYSDEWMSFFSEQIATIYAKNNDRIELSNILPIEESSSFNATAQTDRAKSAWILFGSSTHAMDSESVRECLLEARKKKEPIDFAIFAAFQFDPDAEELIDTAQIPNVTVLRILMNPDLMNGDLKKSDRSAQSLMLVGQPDIELKSVENGKFVVRVRGFDYFNVQNGKVESGGDRNVALWMLDPNYDGKIFSPTKMFFPMKDSNRGWDSLTRTLKNEIDPQKIAQFSTLESCPFENSTGSIAVKIIDSRGLESMRVLKVSK